MKGNKRNLYIGLIAFASGFLFVLQSRSYTVATETLVRESDSSIFQEIRILKNKNDDLRNEIVKLDETLDQLLNQDSALEAIAEELDTYKKLSGNFPVSGPGFHLTIDGDITVPWIVDLVNELFNAGAEAVDVNGIRIVNKTLGLDVLPNGQLLINGIVTTPPLEIRAIGEAELITEVLELPGGILDRIEEAVEGVKIDSKRLDAIQMN